MSESQVGFKSYQALYTKPSALNIVAQKTRVTVSISLHMEKGQILNEKKCNQHLSHYLLVCLQQLSNPPILQMNVCMFIAALQIRAGLLPVRSSSGEPVAEIGTRTQSELAGTPAATHPCSNPPILQMKCIGHFPIYLPKMKLNFLKTKKSVNTSHSLQVL